jgi:hypothetical protein
MPLPRIEHRFLFHPTCSPWLYRLSYSCPGEGGGGVIQTKYLNPLFNNGNVQVEVGATFWQFNVRLRITDSCCSIIVLRHVSRSYSARLPNIDLVTVIFCYFPQPVKANAGIAPQDKLYAFSSSVWQIQHSESKKTRKCPSVCHALWLGK